MSEMTPDVIVTTASNSSLAGVKVRRTSDGRADNISAGASFFKTYSGAMSFCNKNWMSPPAFIFSSVMYFSRILTLDLIAILANLTCTKKYNKELLVLYIMVSTISLYYHKLVR